MTVTTEPMPIGPCVVPRWTPSVPPPPGTYLPEIPGYEYRNWPAFGRSEVFDLHEDYGLDEVLCRILFPKDQTPAMAMGSMVHCLTMTPSKWDEEFLPAPECEKRSNADKATWAAAEMEALQSHRTLVKTKQVEQATLIHEVALGRSDKLRLMLSRKPAIIEASLYWLEPIKVDGEIVMLPCKARPDLTDPGLQVQMDLKTAKDVRRRILARTVLDRGYHFQMAWYRRGAEQTKLAQVRDTVLVFLCTEPPYRIREFRLPQEVLDAAWVRMQEPLVTLARAYQTGQWSEASPDSIPYLDLPNYATRDLLDALEPMEGDE